MAVEQINGRRSTGAGPVARTSARSMAPGSATDVYGTPVARWVIVLFFLSITAPFFINIGPLTFPPYRLLFLFTMIPMMLSWLSGKYGPWRAVDFMVLAFAAWAALSLAAVHGIGKIYQQIGFTLIETLGAYFMGRALIRNPASFLRFVRIQFLFLLFLLPLGLMETQSGDPVIISFFSKFMQTHPVITYERRLGLERAQTVFQHPIVYGIFSASSFGLVVLALRPVSSFSKTIRRGAIVIVSTICSVSSGAYMALILQWMFMGYDRVMRRFPWRWTLFGGMFGLLYIAIDIGSNRTPFHVFVTYLTLDPSTAWNRILIFQYGSQEVVRNPIFGIGMNDWQRPFWMVPSIDNYWLVVAMRHGYPGLFFNLGTFVLLVRQLSRVNLTNPANRMIRAGILISLGGLMVSAATVHLWGPIYVWVFFLAGASMWLLEPEPKAEAAAATPEGGTTPASRYTRFATTAGRKGDAPPARRFPAG